MLARRSMKGGRGVTRQEEHEEVVAEEHEQESALGHPREHRALLLHPTSPGIANHGTVNLRPLLYQDLGIAS